VWKESLPGHLVSLIPFATDSGVIMFLRDDPLRVNFCSHEGSVKRTLIAVSAVLRLSSWCSP